MSVVTNRQLPPSEEDTVLARTSSLSLARYRGLTGSLSIRVVEGKKEEPIELPVGAVALLVDILDAMAAGKGIALIPENAELSTFEAAEVLNVSRPYVIKLLEEGAIPYRKVGTHRRVRMEDLLAFKEKDKARREAILDELVALAQEHDMGYA